MGTRPLTHDRREGGRGVLAAVAATGLVVLVLWPLPTIVGAFVLGGLWMLGDVEDRRLDSVGHHRLDRRSRRLRSIVTVGLAVGAAVVALVWPWTALIGALLLVSAAAVVSACSGWLARRPPGNAVTRSGPVPLTVPVESVPRPRVRLRRGPTRRR